ncbi:sensor protein KdpD [Anaeromyxobacter oryzisoli]|uniref:sensor protein KdpD n=1 Tax=Anaeromyxobacter oryzisoli TaxID=2925408 RepID=UPI001F589487|nr:universal stress protein [Anaeromyxobacter sp. SG63]
MAPGAITTGRRPSAQDFLELVERRRRGRLKLYIGFAAGVGKTWRMLEEAHALRARNVDVVLGLIEPHGRAETAALVRDLEVVPRRRVEYRGVAVEEMDLEAILARRPQVAIVDEIPHTNVPGSKNRKRYQDVLELLAEGVNVIGALNIQHLESLNDLIRRNTGVRVRETVPDSFLEQADQVVNLDLAVEDLVERLRAGKIYPHEKIPWALEHFFRDQNLATLRELSLREVAESLDRSAAQAARVGVTPGPTRGRVMVALSSNPPHAVALLRRGSRMAGRLNTNWYVVYVETPEEAPDRIDAEAQRNLLDNVEKARELGAEVVRLHADDPAAAMLGFARSHRVSDLIVGRSEQPRWRRLVGRSVLQRLVDEAQGLDLHIVSFEGEEEVKP